MSVDLFNIDCMEYMADQPDDAFDLAIVDPPYFDGPNKLGYFGARTSPIGVSRPGYDKTNNWSVPDKAYFNELQRVSRDQIIWGINYYDIQNLGPGRIIWNKLNAGSSFSDCEIAYCSLHYSVRLYEHMWNGMLQGATAISGRTHQGNKKLNEKRIHPTQKPVKLYEWLLSKYATPGMRILDTHLGSGSSAIAAHYFGCEFAGCEIDPEYFKLAHERYLNETRQMAMVGI